VAVSALEASSAELRRLQRRQIVVQLGLVAALAALVAFFAFKAPFFFTIANFRIILLQSSIIGILAIGQTFVIISGGFDLSVGSIVGLSGVCAAFVAQSHGTGALLPILAAMGVGAAIGAGHNGFLIAVMGVSPFIVTLASLTSVRGLALAITNTYPVGNLNNSFVSLGSASALGVQLPVLIFLGLFVVALLFQRYVRFARHLYALGGNREAASLYGLPLRRIQITLFGVNGAIAGLAGAVLAARIASGEPNAGIGYELTCIAAVIIGGTRLTGGEGGVQRTLLGILILGVLSNGLDVMNMQSFYQDIATGFVIVAAVLMDVWARRQA